jgi:hypothetical protein
MSTRRLGLAVLLAVLAGCGSDGGVGTTRPTVPPGTVIGVPVPLVAQVTVRPAVVTVAAGPSTRPAAPVVLELTLVVSNTTSRDYFGEAPDAAVARFALSSEGTLIGSAPEFAAQAVTPVRIPAGGRVVYTATFTLADARVYRGKLLTASAQFTPAALTTQTFVPVQ